MFSTSESLSILILDMLHPIAYCYSYFLLSLLFRPTSTESYFIDGSDTQGCKVVVVSDHSSVGNFTTMLIKHNESDTSASGQVNLIYHIDCYHHVLAFDIEANGTISSLATRREIELKKKQFHTVGSQ